MGSSKIRKYKKCVEIDGEKFEAEYLEISDNFEFYNDITSQTKSFKIVDEIISLFYWAKNNARELYWKVRYGFQRMFKGYDNMDKIEMAYCFVERYQKILTEYRNKHHGYPARMTNDEWNKTIDDMIHHLQMMDEEYVIKLLSKEMPEGWIPDSESVDMITSRHKDEFFKLFSEYFFFLWD